MTGLPTNVRSKDSEEAMSYEYDDLERRLLELLDRAGPVLTAEEAQDVRMFIDAGE